MGSDGVRTSGAPPISTPRPFDSMVIIPLSENRALRHFETGILGGGSAAVCSRGLNSLTGYLILILLTKLELRCYVLLSLLERQKSIYSAEIRRSIS